MNKQQIETIIQNKTGVGIGAKMLENRRFVAGDHWQGGAGWSGPQFRDGSFQELAAETLARAFVSENVIGTVTRRHVRAVVGKPFLWEAYRIDQPEAEGAAAGKEVAEATTILQEWLKSQQAVVVEDGKLRLKGFVSSLFGMFIDLASVGIGSARLFVSPSNIDEAGKFSGEPYKAVRVTVPEKAENIQVYLDELTLEPFGVYTYRVGDRTHTEICYVKDGATVLREMVEKEGGEDTGGEDAEMRFDLGGRLTMYQATTKYPLVTEQMKQSQKALNRVLTMLSANANSDLFAGFIMTGIQPPGKWEKNATTEADTFVPDKIEWGAGTMNFFSPMTVKDEMGQEKPVPTDVHVKEPSSVEVFTATAQEYRTGIIAAAYQDFTLLTHATVGADSRRQARGDFRASLNEVEGEAVKYCEWVLKNVLAMGADLEGNPKRFENVGVRVTMQVDLGAEIIEEQELVLEARDKGVISLETAQRMLGLDPDAERARLEGEKGNEVSGEV